MSEMFADAGDANPDTINWDTAAVTDMSEMFADAGDANPDTTNWNFASVRDFTQMFNEGSEGLSVANYSMLLISLASTASVSSLTPDQKTFGSASDPLKVQYNATAATNLSGLQADGWVFHDEGQE